MTSTPFTDTLREIAREVKQLPLATIDAAIIEEAARRIDEVAIRDAGIRKRILAMRERAVKLAARQLVKLCDEILELLKEEK